MTVATTPPRAPVPFVVAVSLTKGGTAKTTTAVNLAAELAAATGENVVILDGDTQGQAARVLGLDVPDGLASVIAGTRTAADVLAVARPPAPGRGGLFVLAGGPALAAASNQMATDPAAGMLAVRDAALAAAAAVNAAVVVVDTPPGWGPLSLGSLAAADLVVCPVPPHAMALDALAAFDAHLASVQRARAAFGGTPGPRLGYVLPTLVDRRGAAPRIALDSLVAWAASHRDRPTVASPVPLTVRAQEAPALGRLLAEHAPEHAAAEAYRALARLVAADVSARAASASPRSTRPDGQD